MTQTSTGFLRLIAKKCTNENSEQKFFYQLNMGNSFKEALIPGSLSHNCESATTLLDC